MQDKELTKNPGNVIVIMEKALPNPVMGWTIPWGFNYLIPPHEGEFKTSASVPQTSNGLIAGK